MSIIELFRNIDAGLSTKTDMQAKVVNHEGFPHNPDSIKVPLKRENIPSVEKLHPDKEIKILVKEKKEKKTIHAKIIAIHNFPSGTSIVMDTISGYLKDWKRIVLWIPNEGHCGIL